MEANGLLVVQVLYPQSVAKQLRQEFKNWKFDAQRLGPLENVANDSSAQASKIYN